VNGITSYRRLPWTFSRLIAVALVLVVALLAAPGVFVFCQECISEWVGIVGVILIAATLFAVLRTPKVLTHAEMRVRKSWLRRTLVASLCCLASPLFLHGDSPDPPAIYVAVFFCGAAGLFSIACVWLYWRRSYEPDSCPEITPAPCAATAPTQDGSINPQRSRSLRPLGVVATVVIAVLLLLPAVDTAMKKAGLASVTEIALAEFPGLSQPLLGELKIRFPGISDPVAYDSWNGIAHVVVRDYPESGETLAFEADLETLQQVVNEHRYVESRGYLARGKDMAEGAGNGVVGLVTGLWTLVRHPIQSVSGVVSAAQQAVATAYSNSPTEVAAIVEEMAKAFYTARCIEKADAHGIPYGMTILPTTVDCVHGEVNGELTGEAAFELVTLLVPILKASKAKHAAAAAKVASVSDDVVRMSKAGRMPAEATNFAKHAGRFSKATAIVERNLTRLPARAKPRVGRLPVAKVGRASTLAYRDTFFARNPALRGKVVVHHAVEQQIDRLYPNLFSAEELNSLENLRGIPSALDDTLHKAQIRREWNEFYRLHPASTTTRAQVLEKATDIDRKFGHLFDPPLF